MLRRYLIEKAYSNVVLFYRKKVYSDGYLLSSFYNVTRDVKNVLADRKVDTYNYVGRMRSEVKETVVFFFIDRYASRMGRRLAEFMGEKKDEINPSVFVFRFHTSKRILHKYKFKITRADLIVYSDFLLFL